MAEKFVVIVARMAIKRIGSTLHPVKPGRLVELGLWLEVLVISWDSLARASDSICRAVGFIQLFNLNLDVLFQSLLRITSSSLAPLLGSVPLAAWVPGALLGVQSSFRIELPPRWIIPVN